MDDSKKSFGKKAARSAGSRPGNEPTLQLHTNQDRFFRLKRCDKSPTSER